MKKVAVLFSGGLDSTYLVWKNLQEGNIVYPIYVEIENNRVKTILEKNRTKLLYHEFSKEYNFKIHEITNLVNIGISLCHENLGFKQLPIWILSSLYAQSDEFDEIQIGYVSNDDAISYLDDIQKIYKSYQPLILPSKQLLPLKFPLIKTKKWEMIRELPKQYNELIISCENPRIIGSEEAAIIKYEPCCQCVPCKSIIGSDYYETNNYPKNYHNPLLMRFARQLRDIGTNFKIVDENGEDYMKKMGCHELAKIPIQTEIDFYNLEEK